MKNFPFNQQLQEVGDGPFKAMEQVLFRVLFRLLTVLQVLHALELTMTEMWE